ncbi:hypothetical protein FIU87_13525 [Bacillus sp. THAF10]|uniref:hypothetical protein n=1 Tax=Bacillus sp. THAF10 TaxID=2587848 RepID=UPI001267ADE8|nr:hypothetical protein [Bacillus sp. THAF10]QFT89676.1 hypothetical protein FIU87_13525 [Bacillus sp. THAF10]
MVIKFIELEERKLYAAMYFLFKGISLLDDVNSTVFERMDFENEIEKKKLLEFTEKILKISEARARIDDEYNYTEDENEAKRREKTEDEIYEWFEENVFNDKVKSFLNS